jgi:hypothetical protein
METQHHFVNGSADKEFHSFLIFPASIKLIEFHGIYHPTFSISGNNVLAEENKNKIPIYYVYLKEK